MKNQLRAFSILESVLALALLLGIVAGLSAYSVPNLNKLIGQQKLIEAQALAQEGVVLVDLIARRDWLSIDSESSSLINDQGVWRLIVSDNAERVHQYERSLRLEKVCRDVQAEVVDCPAGAIDGANYLVTVTVSWLDLWGQKQQLQVQGFIRQII